MPTFVPPGSKRVKTKILGPDGKPAALWLYPSPRYNVRQYKPRQWLSRDTRQNVNEYDRSELVNYSRQLFAQIGNLNTAVRQKNNWAFGDAWEPHYYGRNPKWGQEAEEFLKYQFYPNANIRGPIYPFKRSLELSGKSWDIDGDDVMVLTETATGFPSLAFYPSTQIGTTNGARGTTKNGIVEGGPYDGARIFDGIIYDRNNRPLAVRILNEDGGHTDVSMYNADLAYEPDWSDQGRGIPRVASCLLRWMDLQDIDDFIRRGMKRASSVGIIVKTEEGEGGLGNEVFTSEDPVTDTTQGRQVHMEEIEGGEAYYMTAGANESIESLKYENPHPNSEAFVERVVRECLASVGWFYELLNLQSTGRAPSRLVCDLANQSVWDRQSTGYRRAKRAIGYAIAKAMKTGRLSKNEDGIDPYLWEFGLPKQITVDAGNEEQADRENLKMGTTSLAIVAQKRGWHWQEIRKARQDEIEDLVSRAKAISDKHKEVPFDVAMSLLEQRSPNPEANFIHNGEPAAQAKPGANGNPGAGSSGMVVNAEFKIPPAPKRNVKFLRNEHGEIVGAETL